MRRRDFMKLGGATVLGAGAVKILSAQLQQQSQMPVQMQMNSGAPQAGKADVTLQIAPVTVDLAPNRIISTIGYNGTAPGPILRMREGVPITVDVINDNDVPEYVHWHGFLIPSEVDGSEEEGTPPVPPRGRHRYQMVPKPAGTRWYHTHTMAMDDLHRGSYTGQFGFVMIESGNEPGHYDQEVFLALRDWEPFFTDQMEDNDEEDQRGPQPEKPVVLDTRPNGLEVSSVMYSINDKALGAGEPIRVKPGQRELMHFLNASAIENRRIALAGHQFHVLALDGSPVPTPQSVDMLFLGPGERADVYVEMNQPGVWILGAPEDNVRNAWPGALLMNMRTSTRNRSGWLPRNPSGITRFSARLDLIPRPIRQSTSFLKKFPVGPEDSTAFW